MIFEHLNKLKIPYIVAKHKICSIIDNTVGRYAYEIVIDYDPRLTRLGFHNEWEIYCFRGKYMTRPLSHREIRVFKTYGHTPSCISEHGTIWEINGRLQRHKQPDMPPRDKRGRFTNKPD